MKIWSKIGHRLSFIQRYHYRWVVFIALSWTIIDVVYWLYTLHLPKARSGEAVFDIVNLKAVLLRSAIVLLMSSIMGYLLIFRLRRAFRNASLISNLLMKIGILLLNAFIMNFFIHFSYSLVMLGMSVPDSLHLFFLHSESILWLFQHSLGWVVLFLITLLSIEFYEKYSPGVFWDILTGRYIQPKVQKRIVMFLDLKDSTPIAEQLDSQRYFSFIRDFIYYVSIALLEYDGRIYQYVGDEIVVSWLQNARNTRKCIAALKMAKKLLNRSSRYFHKRYGFIPEFKAGIHAGEVTVGQVGIIKKDIAISGNTMNTAARIRTACSELNRNYIASKDFLQGVLIGYDSESLGEVELKGKTDMIELFSLKL